mmetsp:Transcript_4179/g.16889  ORF Transcript_4179/g.16889 Transcript_4179/m.16889 type:complete len:238 (-) Transcript_4179:452-1165(-)
MRSASACAPSHLGSSAAQRRRRSATRRASNSLVRMLWSARAARSSRPFSTSAWRSRFSMIESRSSGSKQRSAMTPKASSSSSSSGSRSLYSRTSRKKSDSSNAFSRCAARSSGSSAAAASRALSSVSDSMPSSETTCVASPAFWRSAPTTSSPASAAHRPYLPVRESFQPMPPSSHRGASSRASSSSGETHTTSLVAMVHGAKRPAPPTVHTASCTSETAHRPLAMSLDDLNDAIWA